MADTQLVRLLWIVYVCIPAVHSAFSHINSGNTTVPHSLISSSEDSIHLQGNDIVRLEAGEFSIYENLTELSLQKNLINYIADDGFSGTKLAILSLSANKLTTFPTLTSISATLTTLKLKNNYISVIDQALLSELKYIERLDLSWNALMTDMPDFTEVGSLSSFAAETSLLVNGVPFSTTTFCHFQDVILYSKPYDLVPQINCPGSQRLKKVYLSHRRYTSATDVSTLVLPS